MGWPRIFTILSCLPLIDAIELIDVTSILKKGQDWFVLTKLFAGFSAPNNDDSFIIIDHLGLQIRYKFNGAQSYQSYDPILTSFYDTCYHCANISNIISDVIIKAAGTQGIFLNQKCSQHTGFPTYIGKRSKKAQNILSPSEGPQHPSQQNGYWLKTLHVFNEIARSTSHVAYYIYKHICCPYNERSSLCDIFFYRLLIATINFSCAPHCDNKDVLKQNKAEEMVSQLEAVKNHTTTKVFGNDDEVQCVLNSVLSSGLCLPTTFCYQIIKKTPTRKIEVNQYFCLPTLGICFCIKKYWVHCFLAGFFCHYLQ